MRTRLHTSLSGPVPEDNSGHRVPHGHEASSPSAVKHVSVLLHETIEGLDLQKGDVVIDATLGGAGHAMAIADKLDSTGVLVGFDLDQDAIDRAHESLKDTAATVHLQKSNFRHNAKVLDELGLSSIDKALFDLGWSSFQLVAGRGFSFLNDEPLAMTYSKVEDREVASTEWRLTAREIVNEWQEESIADVIYGWGEDRYARRIAKAIVERRSVRPIEMSRDLAEVVSTAVPHKGKGKIHPATKTFQALRIAVNDEFGAITEGLTSTYQKLSTNGRIAVISFHSAEDRIVKRLMKSWTGRQLTKKPIVPSDEEIARNPRSRSAKLRIFIKSDINNQDPQ